MDEIWKDVPGYEGYYQVSNLGNVHSLTRYVLKSDGVTQLRYGKPKNQFKTPDGYLTVKLSKDGTDTRIPVHRLVAECFVSNPENKPEVNHIDFNRENNIFTNLEWATHMVMRIQKYIQLLAR